MTFALLVLIALFSSRKADTAPGWRMQTQGSQEEADTSRCQIRQNTSLHNAFAPREANKFFVVTYENVAGAQECAILCASHDQCKTFSYVKDPSHPLQKQCSLTRWEGKWGKVQEFPPDTCCDSGFPCIMDDLTSDLKRENQLLQQEEVDELKRLGNSLKSRQAMLVEKDAERAERFGDIQRLRRIDLASMLQRSDENATSTSEKEIKRLEEEIEKRDLEIANDKIEMDRLRDALDIRQLVFNGKDVDVMHFEAVQVEYDRLKESVQALNYELQKKTLYVYSLSSGVAFTIALLCFIVYKAFEQWLLHMPSTVRYLQGSNAALTTTRAKHKDIIVA